VQQTKNQTLRRSLALGITVLIAFSWFWIFQIDIAKLSDSLLLSFGVALLVFATSVGITVIVLLLLIRHLKKTIPKNNCSWQSKAIFLLKVFVAWAFVELFAAWLVTIVWYGPHGSVDSILPFASLTPTLMYTPLGLLSRLFGYHGLSALVVTLAAGGYIFRSRKYAVVCFAVVGLFMATSYLIYRVPMGTEVNIEIAALSKGSQATIKTDAELVILPEYGIGLHNKTITDSTNEVSSLQSNGSVYFVGSTYGDGQDKPYNMAVFGNTKDGIIQQQGKVRLIPGAEYMPYGTEFLLRIFRDSSAVENFELFMATKKSTDKQQTFYMRDGVVLGSAICSSIIAPDDYRLLTRQGATLLTNSASLGVFKDSKLFWWQYDGMAKFIAVANARPLAQSTYDAPAYVIDHNGNKKVRLVPVAHKQVDVATNSQLTPYTLLGEWPAWLGGGYIAFIVFSMSRKKILVTMKQNKGQVKAKTKIHSSRK
jgi:hypothetical protein